MNTKASESQSFETLSLNFPGLTETLESAGISPALLTRISDVLDETYQTGYDDGHSEGYDEGYADGTDDEEAMQDDDEGAQS